MCSRCRERVSRALLVPPRQAARGLMLALAALLPAVPVGAQAPAVPELRVCADPNNLPFSNRRREGFENRVAEVLAEELGARLRYTWAPQWRGFVRKTLGEGRCDVLMGVPSDFDRALTTRPYYGSTYVVVSRAREGLDIRSLDDPVLRQVKVGVHLIGDDYTNTPPAHALAARGIIDNVVGFPIYGNYAEPNPPAAIIRAVAEREVDVALVWGPFAGYFAERQSVPLRVTRLAPARDRSGLPLAFAIALGVRKDAATLRDALDSALDRRQAEIRRILDRYGVPRPTEPVVWAR